MISNPTHLKDRFASPCSEQYQPITAQDLLMFIQIFGCYGFLLFRWQGAQSEYCKAHALKI